MNPKFDMSPKEFEKLGSEFIKWINSYFNSLENYPVLSQVKPGEIKNEFPSDPPVNSEKLDKILIEVENKILKGITHWNHPGFMAYFSASASRAGILADLLSSAFNSNGMLWRTSPALTELEEVTLNWFKKFVKLPTKFWGIIYDTASVSTTHVIAAARENIPNYNIRNKGMSGRNDIKKLRLYCSEHTHSSIEKAAILLGIGLDGVCKIPVDSNFRIQADALQFSINEDRKKGYQPFCVVATIGTTSTTSVDPIKEISAICKKENLWLHVDAAYAGVLSSLDEMKHFFEGWEEVDSIVINPHKWFFVPIDLSILFTSKREILKQAFSLIPEYLKTNEQEEVINFMDYGIQLGRRFRALKLWFVFNFYGVEGLKSIYREHLRFGKIFLDLLNNSNHFEVLAPMNFSTICFRAVLTNTTNDELNKMNEVLMNKINQTGKIFLSHTKLNGMFSLRIVFSTLRTEEKHVYFAWEIINKILTEILRNNKSES